MLWDLQISLDNTLFPLLALYFTLQLKCGPCNLCKLVLPSTLDPNALNQSAPLAANGVALARQEVICCSSVQQQRRTSASSCGPQAAPRSRRRRRGHQQSGMGGEVSSSALHMHRPLPQAQNGSMTTQLDACLLPKMLLRMVPWGLDATNFVVAEDEQVRCQAASRQLHRFRSARAAKGHQLGEPE